jgi:hypothetical protein
MVRPTRLPPHATSARHETMGLLDGVIATAFQRDIEGRSVYCPLGVGKRCYLITAEQEESLIRFTRAWYGGFFLILVPAAYYLRWWVLLLVPVLIGGMYLRSWLVVRHLAPFRGTIAPLSASAVLSQHARATGKWILALLLLASITIAGYAVWLVIRGDRSASTFLGLAVGILGALAAAHQLRRPR